jgi:transposase
MFPRIKRINTQSGNYEYLVLSESVRGDNGKSTTRDVAKLGNLKNFDQKTVEDLVDGLIRLFDIETYGRTDDVEILESLEHGSILLWQTLWRRLKLGQEIQRLVKRGNRRLKLEVWKFVELMVVGRCIQPGSKLAGTRWYDSTCYKAMKGYQDLETDVEYFYRSMDHLLAIKEALELAIFSHLRDLFSINVKLTFYDITSTFFHTDSCPIAEFGHSRDHRPDKQQIVIGVVTSFEGYPIKHFVFEGNTKDETTVGKVVTALKQQFNIEETIFVGDRGMITRLNLERIENEEFDYIMGVKHRQSELAEMVLDDAELFTDVQEDAKGLLKVDRHVRTSTFLLWKISTILNVSDSQRELPCWQETEDTITNLTNDSSSPHLHLLQTLTPILTGQAQEELKKNQSRITRLLKKYEGEYEKEHRFVVCCNTSRKVQSLQARTKRIAELSTAINEVLQSTKVRDRQIRIADLFAGHRKPLRRFFDFHTDESGCYVGCRLNASELLNEERYDGVFVLGTNRQDLSVDKVVGSYKNLQEVETLFDDLKHFVDINPVRHWLEGRVRAHVFICILSLLLKRVFEIDVLKNKCTTIPLEEIHKSKLVKYRVKMSPHSQRTRTFYRVTAHSKEQLGYFCAAGINHPASVEEYVWC